jgi:hypothetical protein
MLVITAYFVDPEVICAAGRDESKYVGNSLHIQNGASPSSLMTIPLKEDDVANTDWVYGKCVPAMGNCAIQFFISSGQRNTRNYRRVDKIKSLRKTWNSLKYDNFLIELAICFKLSLPRPKVQHMVHLTLTFATIYIQLRKRSYYYLLHI